MDMSKQQTDSISSDKHNNNNNNNEYLYSVFLWSNSKHIVWIISSQRGLSISSIVSSNSEAKASELLETLEEIALYHW